MRDDLVTLGLAETAADVYDWGAGDQQPVLPPATPPGANPRPENVTGLDAQATSIVGTDGQELPAVKVFWNPITDGTITSVQIDIKVAGAGDDTAQSIVSNRPASGSWTDVTISSGILASTDYEYRSTITTFPARSVTFSAWKPITTSDDYVVKSAGELFDEATGGLPASEIVEGIENATETGLRVRDSLILASQSGDAGNDIVQLLDLAAETELATILESERQRADIAGSYAAIQRVETTLTAENRAFAEQITLITAQVGDNQAQIIAVDQARVEGDTALALSIDALTVTVGDNTAAIIAEEQARIENDLVLASSITSLSTTVDGNTASITTLQTSVDGLYAEYVVAVEAGGQSGGLRITGATLPDGSAQIDFGVVADRFFIVDPADYDSAVVPFLVSEGITYISELVVLNVTADDIDVDQLDAISANMGVLTTGKIQNAAQTVVFDVDNGRLVFE